MITSVHTVLIGKQIATATSADALNEGDVALFDENRKVISANDAANAKSIYVGVAGKKINVTMPDGTVAQKANIDFSNEIQKASKPSLVVSEHVEPTEETVTINLASATIVAGHRYVVRILYKDIEARNLQFTHTYEVYAESATASDLASAIVAKINKHTNRRVQASVSGSTITLTAMVKDDNEGIDSINEYSVVNMEISLYVTKPGALLSNQPEAVPGAVITKTVGNPGKGYWKQVRDAEARNMGYKGHVFINTYPIVEQARKVVEDTKYDVAIIENDNLYLSNDNQYIKTTPLTTEIYVPSFKNSTVETGIQNFIAA